MFVYYFSNSKSWIIRDIMKTVPGRLDCKMNVKNHKVILFLVNALGKFTERFN